MRDELATQGALSQIPMSNPPGIAVGAWRRLLWRSSRIFFAPGQGQLFLRNTGTSAARYSLTRSKTQDSFGFTAPGPVMAPMMAQFMPSNQGA